MTWMKDYIRVIGMTMVGSKIWYKFWSALGETQTAVNKWSCSRICFSKKGRQTSYTVRCSRDRNRELQQ